jgi:hypothetical protein
MGCILKTRNPIKGTFHTSLVGYMLTDVGVDQNLAVDYLKANKGVSEKDNDWGFLKSNNYNSDFSEPDVRYALQLLSGVGKIDELDWMEEAQNFYDSKNMSLDDEYSLEDILNNLKNQYAITKSNFTFKVVEVPDSEQSIINGVSQKRYKLYPVKGTYNNKVAFKNQMSTELSNPALGRNSESVNVVNQLVDINDPKIETTIQRIINHPEVSNTTKKLLRDLLPLVYYFNELKLDIKPFILATQEEPGMSEYEKTLNLVAKVPGVYDPQSTTITMAVVGQPSFESFANTFVHELQHAVTLAAVYDPKTEIQRQLSETISRAHAEYLKLYKSELANKNSVTNLYGLTNPGEFIVAFLSNPEFRKYLKSNEKTKSIWQTIVDAIKSFLRSIHNVQRNNKEGLVTIEQLNEVIDNYFDEVKNTQIVPSQATILNNKTFNHVLTEDQYETLRSKYATPTEFQERLKLLLESKKTNWNAVYQNALGINLNKEKFYDIMDLYNNITVDEVKASIESFNDFLFETSRYLRELNKSLEHLKDSEILSERDYFVRAYYAKEVGDFFNTYIEEVADAFKGRTTSTVLEKHINNIKALSSALSNKYISDASEVLANMLAEEFKKPTEKLKGNVEKEIERLEKVLSSAQKSNNEILAKQTLNKIQKEKEQLKNLASVENLRKAFKGNIKDVSQISLYLESAALTGNLLTGVVGGFLSNMFDNANAEAIKIEIKAKRTGTKLENYLKSNNKTNITGFNIVDSFMPFIQRKKILELKNGEIVERESYFLISEMDEIEYLNDKVRLEKQLIDLKNSKKQTPEILEKIKQKEFEIQKFVEEYEESYYTDEYYNIQNSLSEEAKQARQEILDEMFKIRITPFEGEQTEEELEKLDELKVRLNQLESDYDEYGIEKNEEDKRIAQDIREWKALKKGAELIEYEITPEHQEIFDQQLAKYKKEYEDAKAAYDQAVIDQDEYLDFYTSKFKVADKNYSTWLKNNAVRRISPTFYNERKLIFDAISAIQEKYLTEGIVDKKETISELQAELFALLKGYKNEDGFYEGSKTKEDKVQDENGNLVNISFRVKELETKIEKIRDNLGLDSRISDIDKKKLNNLFSRLGAIQKKINTPDYERVLAIKKAEIRSKVLANPSNQGLTRAAVESLVFKELIKTEWYKDNHRKVEVYNESLGYAQTKDEPIFMWRTTIPVDESLISYSNPSFKWTTPKVNPKYINENRKTSKKHKRVSLKKSNPKYRNTEYTKMTDPTLKEILNEITELYEIRDKGLPLNLKRGLEIPYVEKEGIESLGNKKVGTLTNQIKGAASSLWDEMTYRSDEDLKGDEQRGSVLSKYSRRLYLKYNKEINESNIDRVSLNLLNTITMSAADAARFKEVYKNLPYIYGIQDVLEKELPTTNIRKVINNMLERRLNAQTTKTMLDNKIVNVAEWSINKALGYSAYMALSLRLPSTIKNNLAGNANIYIQADLYGLSRADISKAKLNVSKHFIPLFRSYVEDGIEHEYIQKVKYFNILPEDHLANVGKKIFVSEYNKKSKEYNPLYYMAFLRNFGEFEMRASVAEALSQTYLIEHVDGSMKPIMDSFEMVDGVLTPMSTIKDQEGFNNVVQHFRGELNLINSFIHGAYGYMDKAEYTRYTLGRLFGYMKGWLVMQTMRRFGRKSISYRAGVESQGFYRTLIQAMGMIMGNRSLANTWELLSPREKNEVIAAGYDTMAVSIMTMLAYLLSLTLYDDSDDDEDNILAYFVLYNILQLEDELATLHPVAGPSSIVYSRFINNPNGKTAGSYYLEKTFLLPFKSIKNTWDLIEDMVNPFDDVSPFDEYIPRSQNGNILNPKQFPINPGLKGHSEILARSLMLFGLDASWNYTLGANDEFLYRRYENLNERWFVGSADSELSSIKSDINSNKKKISSMKRQLEYIEDEDTKQELQSMIEELNKEVEEDTDTKQKITDEYFSDENYIQ